MSVIIFLSALAGSIVLLVAGFVAGVISERSSIVDFLKACARFHLGGLRHPDSFQADTARADVVARIREAVDRGRHRILDHERLAEVINDTEKLG